MERLTKRGTRKSGYVSAIGSGFGCWGKIIDRLAAYEDTGLTPENVVALTALEPADHAVRGQWQGEGDGYADGEIVYDVWRCSECDHVIDDGTDNPELLPNYCPNCGAKMTDSKDHAPALGTPLTLEELREVSEDYPILVWVVCIDEDGTMDNDGEWQMFDGYCFVNRSTEDYLANYGTKFVAYRRKPEENAV